VRYKTTIGFTLVSERRTAAQETRPESQILTKLFHGCPSLGAISMAQ